MGGDAVGSGFDRDQCRAHRIGPLACPRVAKGGDVIDIDSEAQRRSFWHTGLADKFRERLGQPECRAPARPAHPSSSSRWIAGSSLVKPSNDELSYPLTRSTRATTSLARNWAIIALRCFRS